MGMPIAWSTDFENWFSSFSSAFLLALTSTDTDFSVIYDYYKEIVPHVSFAVGVLRMTVCTSDTLSALCSQRLQNIFLSFKLT